MTWPEDRVLVASITRRRDLRLAREAGWYRIPFGRMPQGIPAEYIAFFTGARVAQRDHGGIYGFARVKGVELLRRRDLLPDEPQRADELYYRVQLGEWQRRQPPLLNREGRAFAFLHSTWDRFCQAGSIAELTTRAPGFVPRERPHGRSLARHGVERRVTPAARWSAPPATWRRRAHPLLDADAALMPQVAN